jgi:hypothetical protein
MNNEQQHAAIIFLFSFHCCGGGGEKGLFAGLEGGYNYCCFVLQLIVPLFFLRGADWALED